MRALQLAAAHQLNLADVPAPLPGPGEALVELRAAALNHRDVWMKRGEYAGVKFPCTPGSDGAGIVTQVGADVDSGWVGQEVVINPGLYWGAQESAQGSGFSILGLPRPGTLAEQVVVPATQLAHKSAHLSWTEAAALPLAGLTAYRAIMTRAQVFQGERVLVTGIGGGVAIAALQIAVALGAEVWVSSSSEDKIARAVALGAAGGFNYTQPGYLKNAGRFQVIVDSAGGPGFEELVDLTTPGARIVAYGATRGNPPVLPMRKIFWRQLSLLGTTMGSPEDWRAMVEFFAMHRIKPIVSDVFPLEHAEAAFDLLQRGGQFGKVVVRIRE